MGLRVLVVDDSRLIVAKLSLSLSQLGHEVVGVAGTGRVAVEKYRELRPDFVTMDVTMPEMDGIEATQHIVTEFPDAKIIIMTSHGQEQVVREAIEAGARGYVLKPYSDAKLKECIERL